MDSRQISEEPVSECFEYHLTHRVDLLMRDRFLGSQLQLQRRATGYQGYISEDSPILVHEGNDILIFKTALRFNNAENCLKWLESKERRDLLQLEEGKGYEFEGNVNAEGYARWLNRDLTKPSPLWKINLLVLLVLYPTVMIFTLLLKRSPLLPDDKQGAVPATPLMDDDHSKNNLPNVLRRWQRRNTTEQERDRTAQSFCVLKADIVA